MPLLPTIEEEGKLSRLRLMWRYRLQFQSMTAASLVFVGSGMRLAWSIFDTPAGRYPNNYSTHNLMMSWFLGAALGALLAALCVQRVTKNVAYTSSGFLLLIAGILSLVLPQHFSLASYSSVCVGAAYGLTHVQALVTGSEVAHKSIRGLLLSFERIFLWLGVCVQLVYTRAWYTVEPQDRAYSMHIDQLQGLLLATLGVSAIIFSLAHRLESPLLLLRQERDLAVGDTLKQLHGQSQSSTELLRLREECRQLHNASDWEQFAEEPQDAHWRRWARRTLPLIKVLLLRCFSAMAVSLPFNRAFMDLSWHALKCEMNCLYWLTFCGLFGSLAGALLVDWKGRRKLCCLSLFVSGIAATIVGGAFQHLEAIMQIFTHLNMQVIALLMLAFELIVCGGVAVPALVYSGEAFSVAHKARCLAGILICEQALQLGLMVACFEHSFHYSLFFFVLGGLSFAGGLLVFMLMPETRQLTLYECLLKFKKVP